MLVCGVACAVSPFTFALAATVQVYVVLAGTILPEPFVGVTVNAVPEQMVGVCAVIEGVGLTVMVKF